MRKFLISVLALTSTVLLLAFAYGPGWIEQGKNRLERDEEQHQQWLAAVDEETRQLHQKLLLADLHADSLLWKRDLLQRGNRGHADVPRLLEGGVALQVLSTVTKSPRGLNYEHNLASSDNVTLLAILQAWPPSTWFSLSERALYQADKLHDFVARAPNRLILLRNRADYQRWLALRAQGHQVLAVILATEGSHALDGDLDNVQRLYDAGFRMMSLQHFFDNRLGGSLHGASKSGLTEFGRQVVAAISDRHIMLDLSHSSEQTVRDVLAIHDGPVLISHSGFYGHCQGPRNISDELMQQIAARGGLIGVGYWDAAVCATDPASVAAAIKYGVGLVGEDHVALGSDFDGATTTSFDSSELILITQALRDAGLEQRVITKVMGGNVLGFVSHHLPD